MTELYRGPQWVVTTHGVDTLRGSYPIAANDLAKGLGGPHGGWVHQLAGKTWIDMDDFVAAYRFACQHFGTASPECIEDEIRSGRALAERYGTNGKTP